MSSPHLPPCSLLAARAARIHVTALGCKGSHVPGSSGGGQVYVAQGVSLARDVRLNRNAPRERGRSVTFGPACARGLAEVGAIGEAMPLFPSTAPTSHHRGLALSSGRSSLRSRLLGRAAGQVKCMERTRGEEGLCHRLGPTDLLLTPFPFFLDLGARYAKLNKAGRIRVEPSRVGSQREGGARQERARWP